MATSKKRARPKAGTAVPAPPSAPAPARAPKPARRAPVAPAAAPAKTRSGRVAIVGRPNVGKSTLLNQLLGEPIAIISHHPQTTRDPILGIVTDGHDQLVFVDTPGLHEARTKLGARMNEAAEEAARSADIVVFVADASRARPHGLATADEAILRAIPESMPVVCVLNKVDQVSDKAKLLPLLEGVAKLRKLAAIVPICAVKGQGVPSVLEEARKLLPEGEPLYPADEISDRPVRFFVAEFVREQILRKTRREVPHGVAVVVEAFDEGRKVPRIDVTVHVDKESHKPIILGAGGSLLKAIGTEARMRVETLLGQKVNLQLRVRVTPKWYESDSALRDSGIRLDEPRRFAVVTKHVKRMVYRSLPGGLSGLPIVAIVGRPNVGKSTLFNRLAKRRLAIVHDEPGVTRDRQYADTMAFGRSYTLVDTGGFDPESDDPMKSGIATHVKSAVKEADVILFMTDATMELNAADRAAVTLLRRSGKPVLYAANKADSPKVDADAFELYRLGVEQVFPVSGLHGRGLGDLESAIVSALPKALVPEETEDSEEIIPRIAIVGRPNAGKSSLVNRILGEDRNLVDDRPGTTRDAIESLVERDGKRYVFVDTAGLRRKGKVAKADDTVEGISVLHSVRAIDRADVTVLVCDGPEGVAEQDAKILGLANDRGRAMVIALNKCDLLSKSAADESEEGARDEISFAPYVPIVRISAKTGRGVNELFRTVDSVAAAFTKRIGTGELNRFFETVLDTRPPPTSGGKAPRLYYITQVTSRPPTFVVIASAPEAVHFSYQRFVVNQLRKAFGFEGVPVRVLYKAKKRKGEGKPGEPPIAAPKKPRLTRRKDKDR